MNTKHLDKINSIVFFRYCTSLNLSCANFWYSALCIIYLYLSRYILIIISCKNYLNIFLVCYNLFFLLTHKILHSALHPKKGQKGDHVSLTLTTHLTILQSVFATNLFCKQPHPYIVQETVTGYSIIIQLQTNNCLKGLFKRVEVFNSPTTHNFNFLCMRTMLSEFLQVCLIANALLW